MSWFYLLGTIFFITIIVEFTRDFYKSLYYCFKNKRSLFDDFFGLVGFLGYYGQGKSLAMSHTILKYMKFAKKENVELKIYTNYHFNYQNGQLSSLEDIVRICDEKRKSGDTSYTVFAIDELQNCLNSRQWNDTKKLESLLPVLTMTRKLRVMLLYTSPVASMSDKTIRISSKCMYLCKKINRYFFIRWRLNPVELENMSQVKLGLFPTAHTLLEEEVMNSYDSFAFIETLQKQDYMAHNEVSTDTLVNTNVKIIKKK